MESFTIKCEKTHFINEVLKNGGFIYFWNVSTHTFIQEYTYSIQNRSFIFSLMDTDISAHFIFSIDVRQ